MTQLQITAFGTPEVLQLREGPRLEAGPGQLLLEVGYAGVNPIDAKTRAGLGWAAEQNRDKLPWTPGYDLAGRVLALGEGVSGWHLGQRVCGMLGFPLAGGAYASRALARPEELVPLPDLVSGACGAGLPLAGLTAWQALFEHGGLQAGQTVLITAAAGGVGHIAVQLARQAGARVLACASSRNHGFLRELGADQVLDYRGGQLAEIQGQPDLVLDLVGGDSGLLALSLVKPGGRLVTVPTLTAAAIEARGSSLGVSVARMLVHADQGQLRQLVAACERGALRIEVSRIVPLSQGAEAHRAIETGHTRGKLVLRID